MLKYSALFGLMLALFVGLMGPLLGDDGPDIRTGNPTTIPDPPPTPPGVVWIPNMTSVGAVVHGPLPGGRMEVSAIITVTGTEVPTVVVLYEFNRDQQQWVGIGMSPVIPAQRENTIDLWFPSFAVDDSTRRISFVMFDGNVPPQSIASLPVDLLVAEFL